MSKATISIGFSIDDSTDGLKKLTLDADGLRKAMTANVKLAADLKNSMYGFAAAAVSINAITNAVSGLSSFISSVTQESKSFGDAMRAANTMAGKDAAGFKAIKGDVAALAKEIPIARDALANGLYQTISNGVPEDNWLSFLEASAKSSVGGIADLGKVVGVTSTIIKNYGLGWDAAIDIQDKIQLTAKNGVTSFEQLADALPRVAGNAATLGVSVEELMATFSTLTGVSGNTAEVSTQLGAIFTALVKPSSEATKAAAKLGIEFNAAAIKGAGGFRNFLTQLDGTIQEYAQAHNVLAQEVYGKLFGSAESLRALIPLTGELSDKFAENVDAMNNSAGTIDEAFADMANTSDKAGFKLQALTADIRDWIAGCASSVQPMISFGASLLQVASQLVIVSKGFTALATPIRAIPTLFRSATVAVKSFSIAAKTALISSGIGIAIWAISEALAFFSTSADKAKKKASEFAAAAQEISDAESAGVSASGEAAVKLQEETKELHRLIKAKADTGKAVIYLNKTYGDFFGTQKTAADWYKTLISRSKEYIKYIGLEAQMKVLASKKAEYEIERNSRYDFRERLYKQEQQLSKGSPSRKALQKKTSELTKEINEYDNKLLDLNAKEGYILKELDKLDATVFTPKKSNVFDVSDTSQKAKSELRKIEAEIQKKKEAYRRLSGKGAGENDPELVAIQKSIEALNKKKAAIELSYKAAERPVELQSEQDITRELEYQNELRNANINNPAVLREIDAAIAKLNKQKELLKLSAVSFREISDLHSYADIAEEITKCNYLMEHGDEVARRSAQMQIEQLTALKNKWDELLDSIKEMPVAVSQAKNLSQLDEALQAYSAKLAKASGDEALAISGSIRAYERKREAIEKLNTIPVMQEEASKISRLQGSEYIIKVRGLGFEAMMDQIGEIDEMLLATPQYP